MSPPTSFIRQLNASFLRRPLLYALALVAFAAGGAAVTYSYLGIERVARFRDLLIQREYEGSLSKDMGFLSALTTDLSNQLALDEEEEEAITNRIREHLEIIQQNLEALPTEPVSPVPSGRRPLRSLEAMEDPRELIGWLQSPSLAVLPLEDFGLEAVPDPNTPSRSYLQTVPDGAPAPSFVFVPSTLVTTSSKSVGVSLLVRRELVFSKLVEPHLLTLSEHLPGIHIYQVYFIPYSGFARILACDSDDQIRHYTGQFPPQKSFSDRPYFKDTRQKGFATTEPYFNVAGGGLVKTYSIYIINKNLDMVGMIAIDRPLVPPAELWQKVNLGAGALRDFEFRLLNLHGGSVSLAEAGRNENIPSWVLRKIEKQSNEVYTEIRRWSSEDGEQTVFTVPTTRDQIAFFIFDAGKITLKYRALLTVYIVSLGSLGLLGLLLLYYRSIGLQAEKDQAEIVANLHGGFLVVDSHDRIRQSNQKFSSMVGVGEPAGMPLEDFLTEDTFSEYSASKSSGGFEFPGTIRAADGSTSPVIISSSPIRQGEPAELRMLILLPSSDLELVIGSKFVHSFSHALKTPAHGILQLADTFRRRRAYRKFDLYYSMLDRQIREFSDLINNILQFAELEMKEVEIKKVPVNLAALLRSIAKVAAKRAESAGLGFEEHIPEKLQVHADEGMMRIVFNNLIDNALKYTEEGKIGIHALDGVSQVEVTIYDTGIGIPDEDRDRIFDNFFRSSDPNVKAREGLGIGLHVSRRYVELHGGELILAHASFPGGSEFTVTLPKGS